MTLPGQPDGSRDERVDGAARRLANLVVLQQIQRWLERDRQDQRHEAVAWRVALLVVIVFVVGALLYAGRYSFSG